VNDLKLLLDRARGMPSSRADTGRGVELGTATAALADDWSEQNRNAGITE